MKSHTGYCIVGRVKCYLGLENGYGETLLSAKYRWLIGHECAAATLGGLFFFFLYFFYENFIAYRALNFALYIFALYNFIIFVSWLFGGRRL